MDNILMKINLNELRYWGRSRFRILRPNPKEYSTIVGKGFVVPVQIEAYFLALNKYVDEKAKILDVGFGLGYGLTILSIKSREVNGVEVDTKVLDYCTNTIVGKNPRLNDLKIFDGYHLPFFDNTFDTVTCIDVIEHVEDYKLLIKEMLRVSRKGLFLSTPNRRPEYTNRDGSPKNYWHLREWSIKELEQIISEFGRIDWNFINGPFEGPFKISKEINQETLALSPYIYKTIEHVSKSEVSFFLEFVEAIR
jgi:ubiquinone/menaquinone biosynthesis C-methylase UbiE